MTTHDIGGEESPDRTLASRTERALQQKISVLPTDTAGQFEIVSESGRTYAVDLRADTCDCPDQLHRDPSGGCKHLRRARYATGVDPIPSTADLGRVDGQLGLHVDEEPVVEDTGDRAVVADGGVSSAGTTPADASPQTRRESDETDADAVEEDDESCWCRTRDMPCWSCWQAGERR